MSFIPPDFKVSFIKRIDTLIGGPVVNLLNPPPVPLDFLVKSILIIRPGGIGDAMLLAPAINSLLVHIPDASITILAERRNAGSFSLLPAVDKLLLYDRPADFYQLLRSGFDLILDTEQWHRMSAVVARLVSSPLKIGFATNERRRLFTHCVPYSQDDYEAQSFLNLLKPIGIAETFDPSSIFITLPENADKEIDTLSAPLKSPYITIFPGASIRERRWDILKFRSLVCLLAESGINSVIIGGSDDKCPGDTIITGTSAVNLAGRTSFAGTAALIAKSRLLVSGDSGVLHLGVGLGIPTVSLFGAGIAKKWAPRGEMHRVINRNLHCSPCTLFGTTTACPYDVRCLKEITAEDVYKVVEQVLFKIKR